MRSKILNLHVSLVRMRHFANRCDNGKQVCVCETSAVRTAHVKITSDISLHFRD